MPHFIYLLFEGDLSGLGQPQGAYQSLTQCMNKAKEIHEVVAFFHKGKLMDESIIMNELNKDENDGVISLFGENDQQVYIIKTQLH